MAYRQTRPLPLAMTEIDENRLALRRARQSGDSHAEAIEAARHCATLAGQSAHLMQFVKGV